jgi:hypothetical protein
VKRQLRAPAEHGAVLIDPPPSEIAELVSQATQINLPDIQFNGLPFCEWRDLARRECTQIAQEFCGVGTAISAGPWFVGGHQPDLFHPGVWLKNFTLAALARKHNGVALNLLVDNDTLKHRFIRVPIWDGPQPEAGRVHLATVPFDSTTHEMPFEDSAIQDDTSFNSFAARIANVTHNWPETPIAGEFMRIARQVKSNRIGERFATARRGLEQSWGVRNLEVPVSVLAGTRSFAAFFQAIVSNAPRFHEIYNRHLGEYRARHRIRSANHPVPALSRDGEFWETAFWAWRAGDPRRGRLFAKLAGDALELRTDLGQRVEIEIQRLGDECPRILQSAFKIRPRALTTTLFARLALADVFIHGIGGAIYDELTDLISRDFFGSPPPPFAVATGTLRLPFALAPKPPAKWSKRDLIWKPQEYLQGRNGSQGLIEARNRLIAQQPATRKARRDRYHALRENLDQLAPFVAAVLEESNRLEQDANARNRANAILSSREYSFILHSERSLRQFFEEAAAQATS